MSSEPTSLVATMAKLPPRPGVSFRGRHPDATFVRPGQVTVTRALLPTTTNLDVATDAGTVREVYAVSGRTGRDLTPFSAHREIGEIVFLPGTAFAVAGSIDVGDVRAHLVFETQVPPEPIGPEQVDAFRDHVHTLLAAYEPGPAVDAPPGKFVGDIG